MFEVIKFFCMELFKVRNEWVEYEFLLLVEEVEIEFLVGFLCDGNVKVGLKWFVIEVGVEGNLGF